MLTLPARHADDSPQHAWESGELDNELGKSLKGLFEGSQADVGRLWSSVIEVPTCRTKCRRSFNEQGRLRQ